MPQRINNHKQLLQHRKDLRCNSTSAEGVLWRYLQRSQLDGRKFRRQHSIGKYILDFYCPAEQLAIELDGAQHFTLVGNNNDEMRTAYLNGLGILVIRFENSLVFNQIELVLEEIKRHFGKAQS